ncbi:hypothetical protein Pan97_07470 [Bremerella volcania]|uniref:Nickel uptake substrate-specific transmembrane region n=1 Tax=Bremerella volcania TaxID=2527984 RepID=A0A518C3E4_9BACT|nr:hypothetical protein [Bremerella volcania]QDU73748.1 hypothetical protein Pan97_07470 [Bremerella volcania]
MTLKDFSFARGGVLAALVLSLGCSSNSETVPVHGHVLLNGKPLANAEIIFQPEGKRASIGQTNKEGYYELTFTAMQEGGVVGLNRVMITKEAGGPDGDEMIPRQYNVDTELTADVVESGDNEFNFDLKSDRKTRGVARAKK